MKSSLAALLVFGGWTLVSLSLYQSMPLPTSFLYFLIGVNIIFAFFSIFIQSNLIKLYKSNVYKEPMTFIDSFFKYMAIYMSGLNHYVQSVLSGLPFLVNKVLGIVFLTYLLFVNFLLMGIFFE
ncbi:hypothetical protein [Bacillus sp. P14.5]|uniref:hypothetical protein n=1 Tax=Bacillus sp. P14.5 TaxID=1983400 RepID=UPI000DE95092|nr:hypothetical protein [Bacillus sp. P14.5]